jgi:hypothetical protein
MRAYNYFMPASELNITIETALSQLLFYKLLAVGVQDILTHR